MNRDDAQDFIDEHLPGLYGELPEVMREIFARIPFGTEFRLSNGRVGRFKKFVEPRQRDGSWECAFDIVFDEGSPDHLEFFVKHTGGGGCVCEKPKPILPQSGLTN